MKVIAKPSAPSAAGWLDEDESLTVLAVSAAPLEGVKYLLWSAKQETVALFPVVDFEVMDRQLSPRWIFSSGFQGGFYLGPEAWQVDGFWERYHDGDSIAEQVFEEEKSLIFSE